MFHGHRVIRISYIGIALIDPYSLLFTGIPKHIGIQRGMWHVDNGDQRDVNRINFVL